VRPPCSSLAGSRPADAYISIRRSLLDAINYSSETDTLVLVGDLVAKHPDISQSLETVKYARELGAQVVRGNHDEAVIEWRGLIDERNSAVQGGGDTSWLDSDSPPDDLVFPLTKAKWKGEHFEIARRLPHKDYEWLLGLPLTLHVRSLHTYFVHAGLLPEPDSNKGRKGRGTDADLPLERSTDPTEFVPEPPIESQLAKSAEGAVLLVEQNRKAYNLLNMRGVKKNGQPTKNGKKGSPCKPNTRPAQEKVQADDGWSSLHRAQVVELCHERL
jgi:hypothetical protein